MGPAEGKTKEGEPCDGTGVGSHVKDPGKNSQHGVPIAFPAAISFPIVSESHIEEISDGISAGHV